MLASGQGAPAGGTLAGLAETAASAVATTEPLAPMTTLSVLEQPIDQCAVASTAAVATAEVYLDELPGRVEAR